MISNDKEIEAKKRLKEIKELPLKIECKILRIVKGEESDYDKYKEDLFKQFQNIIKDYKEISSKPRTLQDISSEILLNSALEGIIKIILFVDSPIDYLHLPRRNRTLGNLKNKLLEKIEKEDGKKKEITKTILNLVNELRNNFIHFSFYYENDYRFECLYFQLIAYLFEKFKFWDKIDKNTINFIKEKALNKPEGIDLLEGIKLYEKEE